MEEWEKYVDPKFCRIVQSLQSSLVMDRLRSEGLLNREEFSGLIATATEEERARKLINDILPRKGPLSFRDFCKVLLSVKGQEHIVNDIIQPDCQKVGRGEGVAMGRPTPSPHKGFKFRRALWTGLKSKKACLGRNSSPRGLSRKRKSSKRATFYFKEKHRSTVNDKRDEIYCMCHDLFGIKKKMVRILFINKLNLHSRRRKLHRKGYHFYADAKSILISVVLYGVDAAVVKRNCPFLKDGIAAFLKVPRCKIDLLEVLPTNSAFAVFRVAVSVCIPLLSILGQQDAHTVKSRLFNGLQLQLPGMSMAVLRLGGLPPLRLLSDVHGKV